MRKFLFTLVMATVTAAACADGTIQFATGALYRVTWGDLDGDNYGPVATTFHMNYGVFWGTSPSDFSTWHGPVLPLGTSSTTSAGVIVAPNPFAIPGTEAAQTVYMQVFGWDARFGADVYAAWQEAHSLGQLELYGATDIRQITLGVETGPGTLIWQSVLNTNPNRFHPLVLYPGGGPPPPVVPEPSTMAFLAMAGLLLLFRRTGLVR